ncbi:hypothetical protein [Ottowia sp. SB7-C50]|uniref:hypothetical protein n=1 Tax=Ottowia sp. SB7-C50 TaxID=3081231 RepID=UPI002955C6EA|nr:hypothetical protein [Ottowia sp. SB7-C50]WOP15761.1 hypothetical protein R0D99_01405 [Ottowia sp. SB7-C50]
MSALIPTTVHRTARNQASIDLANAGSGAPAIKLFTEYGGTLLAVRNLKRPCGVLNAQGRIELRQADADDLVVAGGSATYAEWVSGDGTVLGFGDVTDATGAGVFRIAGGTLLIQGGILRLSEPAVLG